MLKRNYLKTTLFHFRCKLDDFRFHSLLSVLEDQDTREQVVISIYLEENSCESLICVCPEWLFYLKIGLKNTIWKVVPSSLIEFRGFAFEDLVDTMKTSYSLKFFLLCSFSMEFSGKLIKIQYLTVRLHVMIYEAYSPLNFPPLFNTVIYYIFICLSFGLVSDSIKFAELD